MPERTPEEIVRSALEQDELDLLLLGSPAYRFLPKGSPAPGDTDLIELLTVLYRLIGQYPREVLKLHLYRAIKKIVESYDGLDPVAACIFYESYARCPVDSFGRPKSGEPLGLPLEEVAGELRQSIRVFSIRLEKDKSGGGAGWPDGRLGDMRRLSKNTTRVGGPSFCD